jgi:hypothetical protein
MIYFCAVCSVFLDWSASQDSSACVWSFITSAVIASGHRPFVRCRIFGAILRERNVSVGVRTLTFFCLCWHSRIKPRGLFYMSHTNTCYYVLMIQSWSYTVAGCRECAFVYVLWATHSLWKNCPVYGTVRDSEIQNEWAVLCRLSRKYFHPHHGTWRKVHIPVTSKNMQLAEVIFWRSEEHTSELQSQP